MSDYRAKLKGWAIDRVIELRRANNVSEALTLSDLKHQADELADYAYSPEEEFESLARQLSELIQKDLSDPLDKIKFLQDELAYAEEQIGHQMKKENVQ